MEVDKRKMIMIAAVVICLLLAVVITAVRLTTTGGGSIDDIPVTEMMWAKCINPKCNAEYEMSKKEFFQAMQGDPDAPPDSPINLVRCQDCGKDSILKAVKCEKCEHVFPEGAVPNDFMDRCPKCKYSQIEDVRKQARQQQ